jgi:hypothetical protein
MSHSFRGPIWARIACNSSNQFSLFTEFTSLLFMMASAEKPEICPADFYLVNFDVRNCDDR